MAPRVVHVVVPDGVDDPARPSGGNRYDRRLCDALGRRGWQVHEHHVTGTWPDPAPSDTRCLATRLDALPDGAGVLVDGLVASAAPELLRRHSSRLRLVVLVHLPLGVLSPSRRQSEASMLRAVAGVVTTSAWTRTWLAEHEGLSGDRIEVALPGADPADLATGSPDGSALLCVGAVTPVKGQDLLVQALAGLADRPWHCVFVGALDVDPGFAGRVRGQVEDAGLASRVTFTGVRTGPALDAAYAAADVLVLPSRAETFGMVVTEALARGLPVIASRAGGTPESVGRTADGRVPGVLVRPDDVDALAAGIRGWLDDPGQRDGARAAARERRQALPAWADTAAAVVRSLEGR